MKIPLIKTTGNLTTAAIILTVEGRLVGAIEKTFPSEAKQREPRIIARIKITGFDMVIPIIIPIITGTKTIAVPNANEASISPAMMVSILRGLDINLSSVFACASQGTTIGEIEVAVKNKIILRSPEIINSTDICLPIVNDKNRKTGKSTPNIITGPLE